MNIKNELINWLRDAYAMERGLETTLKSISESEKHPASFQIACAQHLTETREHAEIVKGLLRSLGSDTSSVKTGIGMMAETLKGGGTAMAGDEVVKDMLSSYASEHFEIASYRAIIAAAEILMLPEVVRACLQIISDEEKMAETLSEALQGIVADYLEEEISAMA